MKHRWLLTLVVAALALPGCLTVERQVLRVTYDPEREYGTVTQVYYNIQSTEEGATGQDADFRGLIEAWKEDRYLVEQLHEEQLYVRSRDLRIEGGVLAGSQTALFKLLSDVDIESGPGDSLFWSPEKDQEVVRTNGVLAGPTEHPRVVWPPGTTKFEVELRAKEFEPRSDFVKSFRKWIKEH